MKHLDASAGPLLESPSASEIFHQCAVHRSPALVLNLESRGVSKAEFRAFSGEIVALDTLSDKSDLFPVASLCSVAFVYGDSSYVFLASVLGFHERPAPEPSRLELETPLQIAASNGRIRYRVPVFRDSMLETKVITENHRLVGARALNLSLTGMLVEFAEVMDPHLSVGAAVHVTLALGGHRVTLAGEVARTHGCQYGIFFRDAGAAGIVDPPEPLRKIVRILERRWLRERIRAAVRDTQD